MGFNVMSVSMPRRGTIGNEKGNGDVATRHSPLAIFGSDRMKIVVLGDQFVRLELFEDALRRHVAPVAGELDLVCAEVDWPDVPLLNDDEVKEYLGDVAEIAGWWPALRRWSPMSRR